MQADSKITLLLNNKDLLGYCLIHSKLVEFMRIHI